MSCGCTGWKRNPPSPRSLPTPTPFYIPACHLPHHLPHHYTSATQAPARSAMRGRMATCAPPTHLTCTHTQTIMAWWGHFTHCLPYSLCPCHTPAHMPCLHHTHFAHPFTHALPQLLHQNLGGVFYLTRNGTLRGDTPHYRLVDYSYRPTQHLPHLNAHARPFITSAHTHTAPAHTTSFTPRLPLRTRTLPT